MSTKNINAALVTAAVAALGPSFANRTAFEGKDFKPPAANGFWAAVNNLRGAIVVASLGVGGMDDHLGVYQIDVSYPENDGTSNLLTVADALRTYFVTGRRFVYSGQCVRVSRCDVSSIRRIDGWLRITASVYYSSYTTRPEI